MLNGKIQLRVLQALEKFDGNHPGVFAQDQHLAEKLGAPLAELRQNIRYLSENEWVDTDYESQDGSCALRINSSGHDYLKQIKDEEQKGDMGFKPQQST